MTKYTVKLILWKYPFNKRGLYPIYLRTTINRKPAYKSTGHIINEKLWDQTDEQVKQGHSSADIINAHILSMKLEWQRKLVASQIKGNDISAAELKESFASNRNNIFQFVDNLIIKLKGKKSDDTLENYRKHLQKLEAFNKSRVLYFENINTKFLQDYDEWLRNNINFRKESPHKNYIHAIWKTLKTWFNAAKKEGIISHYPFDKYDNPVYVAPDKDFLNLEELGRIEKFADTTPNPVLKECAVYFLFGCYSGLRISDWYQFSFDKHIKGNKIRLRPLKTKHKWVEMIISKPLQRNLERMKQIKLTLKEPTINEKLKIIAKELGIEKHLTSHSGRHSFAVTICLANKISSETAAELMGINLETFVKNYSQVTQSKIDKETKQAWRSLR